MDDDIVNRLEGDHGGACDADVVVDPTGGEVHQPDQGEIAK